MSPTAELHPEDMLDAARRGTLSKSARALLDAHLERCPACRMQMAMTADFTSALQVEDPLDGADAEMLTRMVRVASAKSPMRSGRSLGARWSLPTSSRWRRASVIACYVALGCGAASAMWSAQAHFGKPGVPPSVEPATRDSDRGRGRTAIPSAEAVAMPERAIEPESAPERSAIPVAAPLTVPSPAPQTERSNPSSTPQATLTLAPTAERRDRVLERQAAGDRDFNEIATPSASALFAEANMVRRNGDHAGALNRYRRLQTAFPGSREEVTSRVIVGQLLLDRGEPATALASFRDYLAVAPSGTLAEEARFGSALALMRLHRPVDEERAWSELLSRHPSSVHAPRARARLADLRSGLHLP